jgi:hypothetical protein
MGVSEDAKAEASDRQAQEVTRAMETAVQMVGSFLAAALGWVALEFVARPLRKFYDLRGEVIRRLTEYANVRARLQPYPGAPAGTYEQLELSEEEGERLNKARDVLRDLASQMVAFADNETCALYVAKAMRYDPKHAAEGLIGLSNKIDIIDPQARRFHRKMVKVGLRLRDDTPGAS